MIKWRELDAITRVREDYSFFFPFNQAYLSMRQEMHCLMQWRAEKTWDSGGNRL